MPECDVAPSSPTRSNDLSGPAFFAGLAALILTYLAFGSYQLAELPLIDPDEPRYAAAGRTMARGGSWVVPEFNGEKRINKPPFFYWTVALSMKLIGRENELAARLPSVAMGLLMLVLTVFAGRRVYGAKTGLVAGVVLASTALFAGLSRACITDMTLSTLLASGLGLLMLALLERGPPRPLFWMAVLAFGLAILTKATPAFSLLAVLLIYRALSLPRPERGWAWKPILILFGAASVFSLLALVCEWRHTVLTDKGRLPGVAAQWHTADEVLNTGSLLLAAIAIGIIVKLARRAGSGPLKRFPYIAGLLIAMACGVWWYAVLVQRFGWDEFNRLLEFEVAERLAGGVHREGMHYYLTNLFAVAMPWSIALPGALISAWPGEESAEESSPQQRADRFLLAWVAGILLFFTIPGAKLATYILPCFPALALLLGRFVVRFSAAHEPIPTSAKRWTDRIVLGFCATICVAGFIPINYPDDFQRFLNALAIPFGVLGAAFGVALYATWNLATRKPVLGVFALYVSTLVFVLSTAHAAFPVFLLGRSNRDLCLRVKDRIADCKRAVLYGSDREGVVFYLDRVVSDSRRRRVEENESIDSVVREELSNPDGTAVFLQRRYYARMLGLKASQLPGDPSEVAKTVPAYAEFVDANAYFVVLKPKK